RPLSWAALLFIFQGLTGMTPGPAWRELETRG
ncbi:MAG: hypothetical protein ACI9D0_000825, partial [Bacteroidia bacterium]